MPHPPPSIFDRLRNSYANLNILSATLGSGALLLLIHDSRGAGHSSGPLAACLLAGSVMTASFTITVTTMLSFQLQDAQEATSKEHAIAWVPIALVDVALIEFIIGLILWFIPRHSLWFLSFVGMHLAILLPITIGIAFHIWTTMKSSTVQFKGDHHKS
ncbi:hypothetical protein LZ31DRAFT_537143 [Colletotrichum somersetense]|nr:hypothetical protein LZ31DRAFT_537143 [Colletotrichum somersetense]